VKLKALIVPLPPLSFRSQFLLRTPRYTLNKLDNRLRTAVSDEVQILTFLLDRGEEWKEIRIRIRPELLGHIFFIKYVMKKSGYEILK
jgi:hypothetical protein